MNKILPKLLLVFGLPFFLLSCQAKPEEQGIVLNYRIVHFDTQQDQMQVELSITNHSDLSITSSVWELHWNQMKGEIISSSLPQGVSFERINGDYYRLQFSDDYSLKSGETLKLNCSQSGIMDRLAMGPVGVLLFITKRGMTFKRISNGKMPKGLKT